ncbi:amino acid:proton symporter, partial [Mammaliicoccus sciuri]
SLCIILYLILLAFLSFIGSKEFKCMNWIHYPYDVVLMSMIALIFYKIATTSYFESVYFKRAKKINKDMREDLKEKHEARHEVD